MQWIHPGPRGASPAGLSARLYEAIKIPHVVPLALGARQGQAPEAALAGKAVKSVDADRQVICRAEPIEKTGGRAIACEPVRGYLGLCGVFTD